MKVLFAIILSIFSLNGFSQRKINESFRFKDSILTYKLVTYAKYTISDFYVIIYEIPKNSELLIESLKDCYKLKTDFYFLNIKGDLYSKKDKEDLLVELIRQITDKRNLTDSKLHLVLNSDYSEFYKKVSKEKKLNKIDELKITNLENSICELIRGF